MRKLGFVLLCCSSIFQSQGQITFERNDSLEGGGGPFCCPGLYLITQTQDSGYLSAGTIVDGTIVSYFWEKLDSVGHSQWFRILVFGSDARLYSIDQTSDQGHIICGIPSDPRYAIGIVKADSMGMLQWQQNIGIGNGDLYGYSIKQTLDGGFIVAGSKYFPGNWDAEIIKLDSSGSILWSKAYGAQMSVEIFYDISETEDSGFVAVGSTEPTGVFNQIFVVRTNSTGDTLWTKIFQDGFNFTEGVSITNTYDSGFVISGYPKNTWNPGNGSLLFKLDSQGDLIWEKKWGTVNDSLVINSVQQTKDSGFVLSGILYNSLRKGILIKTNSQGDTLWTRLLNGGGGSACESYDEGYAIAGGTIIKTDHWGNTQCHSTPASFGITSSTLVQNYDSLHVIADALGTPSLLSGFNGTPLVERMLCNSLHIQLSKDENPIIKLFPIPSDKILNLQSDSEFSSFEIYNPIGLLVRKSSVHNLNEFEIDISDLSPSIYFIKLYSKEGVATLKFLKN